MLSKLPVFFFFFVLFPSFSPDSMYSVLNLSLSQLYLLVSFPSPQYKFTMLFLAHHAPVYPATLGFCPFCLFHSPLVPSCFSFSEQTLTLIPPCSGLSTFVDILLNFSRNNDASQYKKKKNLWMGIIWCGSNFVLIFDWAWQNLKVTAGPWRRYALNLLHLTTLLVSKQHFRNTGIVYHLQI